MSNSITFVDSRITSYQPVINGLTRPAELFVDSGVWGDACRRITASAGIDGKCLSASITLPVGNSALNQSRLAFIGVLTLTRTTFGIEKDLEGSS